MNGKKYNVVLTEKEKVRLKKIIKSQKNRPRRQVKRAQILMLLDEGGRDKPLSQAYIARRCKCQIGMVCRVSRQYVLDGIDRVLTRKIREKPPIPGIITPEVEEKIIALSQEPPPAGTLRWTQRSLGVSAVERGIVEHISAPTVAKVLRKHKKKL
ncbi:MAG: hypothetical protein LBC53_01225 [Spirochaetaceae bacterium]|jgi:hypothetical protein|nr:hypothetical protein [Spirochaetaceae bacterium]